MSEHTLVVPFPELVVHHLLPILDEEEENMPWAVTRAWLRRVSRMHALVDESFVTPARFRRAYAPYHGSIVGMHIAEIWALLARAGWERLPNGVENCNLHVTAPFLTVADTIANGSMRCTEQFVLEVTIGGIPLGHIYDGDDRAIRFSRSICDDETDCLVIRVLGSWKTFDSPARFVACLREVPPAVWNQAIHVNRELREGFQQTIVHDIPEEAFYAAIAPYLVPAH